MRFDVRAESVFEFVPNNLVEFVGSNLLSPFPNSGSPLHNAIGAWPGDDTGWKQCAQHWARHDVLETAQTGRAMACQLLLIKRPKHLRSFHVRLEMSR